MCSQVAATRPEKHRSFTLESNLIYWDSGPALKPNTVKVNVDWKRNLWWKAEGAPEFNGMDFAAWQASGRDTAGMVADPLFRDPQARDFRLRKDSPALAVVFQPFDFSKAGVYGSWFWRRRAQQ